MKKIAEVICLLLTILVMPIVFAEDGDNKLYFTNKGDRLFYDTKLFDSNIFMNHTDMVPGGSYTDTLLIENGSTTDYKLYFKVKEIDQNENANEILDNVFMEIYIDDELIYQGKAKGLDYNNSGINLQNAIYLGEYNQGTEKKLVVNTSFNEEFSNKDNDELSHIEWQFYAEYEEELIPINPDTGDNALKYIIIAAVCGVVLILMVVVFSKRARKSL